MFHGNQDRNGRHGSDSGLVPTGQVLETCQVCFVGRRENAMINVLIADDHALIPKG